MPFLQTKNQRTAFLWMVLGTCMTFGFLFVVNEVLKKPVNRAVKSVSFGDIKKIQPKAKSLPPPRRKVQKKQAKAPKPEIRTALRGNNFGLQLWAMDLDGLTDSVLGQMDDVAMTEDSVDEPPQVFERDELPYPAKAKEKGLGGYVIVSLLINIRGEVEKALVTESEPKGVFDQVTLQAVRHWKFQPATYKGKKVAVWAKQKVRFEVN